MKRMIVVFLIAVTFGDAVRCQERYLWLRLTEHRVVTNATFDSFSGDSLVVSRGGRRLSISLQELTQIRLIQESRILEGTAIGAGVGLAVGGVCGFALQGSDKATTTPLRTTLIFGVLGAVVGSVKASLEHSDSIVDLNGADPIEKKRRIAAIVFIDQDDAR